MSFTFDHPTCSKLLIAPVVLTALALSACRAPETHTASRSHEPIIVQEPMQREEVAGWWSNGQELLHLQSDGRYVMYGSATQLNTPINRGRWDMHTSERIRLEPYSELDMEPATIAIDTADGEYILRMPSYPEFYRSPGPSHELQETQPGSVRPMSSNTA